MQSTTPPTPAQNTQPQEPSRRSILCIEDEQFIGELYKRALEKAGYEVTVIPDGLEGLEAAKTNQYDIILLDIMIPSILGIEVLNRLRHDKPDLKSKVIITTNLEQDPASKRAIEQQADGYIIKADVTPRQMVEFVRNIKINY